MTSDMFVLSTRLVGIVKDGNGEFCWLFCWLISCGVHVAGENVNREDTGEESDVNSSESRSDGELCDGGLKWSPTS